MSDDGLGSTPCYICKRPLAPLVSICWGCGYSQLPNPHAQGDGAAGAADEASARGRLKSEFKARLEQAKAEARARLKKK